MITVQYSDLYLDEHLLLYMKLVWIRSLVETVEKISVYHTECLCLEKKKYFGSPLHK